MPDAGPSTSQLSREARAALTQAGQHVTTGAEADEDRSGDGTEGEEEDETEEEIVVKALAEASLDRKTGQERDDGDGDADDAGSVTAPSIEPVPPAEPLHTEEKSTPEPDGDDLFSFPSLPTHNPEEPEDTVDDDTQQRMNLLLGLSGPTLRPEHPSKPILPDAPKREVGQGWNLPGYNDTRDSDIDSWCCECKPLLVLLCPWLYKLLMPGICNKDADLVCLGCDNDLYCTECWKEGHEFEKHKARKFVWGQKKRLAGAA